MTHDVVWWEIETPDPAGARAFYGALFGWTFEPAFDGPESELGRDYWLIRDGATGIGVCSGRRPGSHRRRPRSDGGTRAHAARRRRFLVRQRRRS